MATLTDNGLQWNNLGECYSNLQNIAKDKFSSLLEQGEELSVNEVSVLGRILGIVAETDALQEELIFQIFSSFDPMQAEGAALDKMVGLFGLERLEATPAVTDLVLRGDVGRSVPSGSVVGNSKTGDKFTTYSLVQFKTDDCYGVVIKIDTLTPSTPITVSFTEHSSFNKYQPISVPVSGSDTEASLALKLSQTINTTSPALESFVDLDNNIHVMFRDVTVLGEFKVSSNLNIIETYATTTGMSATYSASVQLARDLNVIQTPILGWKEVYNPFDSTPSTEIESDAELRNRFKYSRGLSSTGNREGMYAALYSLNGVKYVNISEEIQDTSLGAVAHGISVTVLGGDSDDVAKAIDSYRAFSHTSGSIQHTLYDINGIPYTVRFNRPTPIPIKIKLSLDTIEGVFPVDGILRIKNNIVQMFNSMNVGEDVVWSKLFSPINLVEGQSVSSLAIAKLPNGVLSTSNIEIKDNELATISYEDIEIE